MLDSVFGPEAFVNEIVWKRTSAHNRTVRYGPVHDVILFYAKGQPWYWQEQFIPYDESYVKNFYRHVEPETDRRYQLDNMTSQPRRQIPLGTGSHRPDIGTGDTAKRNGGIRGGRSARHPRMDPPVQALSGRDAEDSPWTCGSTSASRLHAAKERVGWPTQKPIALDGANHHSILPS